MRLSRGATSVAIVAVAAVVTAATVTVDRLGDRIARVEDDPRQAWIALGLPEASAETATRDAPPLASVDAPPGDGSGTTTYLVVGSDARPGLAGTRADVVMLALLPERTTTAPALVSLPRDLWVEDLCHGGRQRLNAALNGCGRDVTGAQLLTLTVEQVTGVRVDHYVEFDFAGFEAVVAAVGGIEVCTAAPVRDRLAHLDLPGGCLTASPEQALGWVRARHLEEYVGGRWYPVPGVNDLSRNQRQQQVLMQVAARAADLRSPLRLRSLAEDVLPFVTIGDRLSLDELLADAWRWRHLDPEQVDRTSLPVTDLTTAGGARVLLPPDDLEDRFARILDRLDAEPT